MSSPREVSFVASHAPASRCLENRPTKALMLLEEVLVEKEGVEGRGYLSCGWNWRWQREGMLQK